MYVIYTVLFSTLLSLTIYSYILRGKGVKSIEYYKYQGLRVTPDRHPTSI